MTITHKFTRTLPNPTQTHSGFVFLLSTGWFTQADQGAVGSPIDDGDNSLANGGGDIQAFSDEACTQRVPIHVVEFVTGDNPLAHILVRLPSWSAGDTITIGKDDVQTVQPAVEDTYGRNAVYQDRDRCFPLTLADNNITDVTGNENLTLTGSASAVSAIAPYGSSAVDFNGTGHYTGSNTSPTTNKDSFYCGFWVNSTGETTDSVILGQYEDDNNGVFYVEGVLSTGRINFHEIVEGGLNRTTFGVTNDILSDGLDHFVQYVSDQSTMALYIDGELESSRSRSFPLASGSTAPFNIGTMNGDVTKRFNGAVQDVEISTTSNIGEQRQDIYANRSNPDNFGVSGEWVSTEVPPVDDGNIATVATDSELREIFANAPVVKDTFEVITLTASWFSKDYHLQNTFTEGVKVVLEDKSIVTAEYAPMEIGQTSSNADLAYERSIVVQQVNDIIASEIFNRDPENDELPVIESRGYVMYRDGTVSQLKTPVIRTKITKVNRDDVGANITSSAKPVNAQATGELTTATRFEMLRGFL